MDCFVASLLAMTGVGISLPSRHLLRRLPEHILSCFLVERLLHEFSDRKARLHLRPRANLRIPALDVGIIVERKPLGLVRHGPWKAGDVGDRILAGDVSTGLAQLRIEHPIKPGCLIAIALDGVGDFLLRVEREMTVLAEHGAEAAHLPHHPLHHPGPPAHIWRQKAAGLVSQIDQDGAGFEHRKRLAAIGRRVVHDRRNPIIRADRQKVRLELVAGPDVDGDDRIGNAKLLQHDRDFPAVRRRRVIEVDHAIILREASDILACGVTLFQSACGLVGRMANMAHRRSIRTDREAPMLFPTTIAGSLPKPEWLAEPNTLWAPWKSSGAELTRAKRDATLLALKLQEDAGVDIVTEGEQARQHFVHGFLEKIEGIDFAHKVEMGIRKDRYKAMVPQVVAPLRLTGRVHAYEARIARTHTTRKLKFTLPGPMTIIDTIADQYYGDRVKMAFAFAELLNEEAKALAADGVDVIQFDEPAFNVYMREVGEWGIEALHRAIEGLTCTTAVHICYGYGIKANIDWKATLGGEWRQYEQIFPALAKSRIDQVSVECRNSRVPVSLLRLLDGKDVQVGVIDVATDEVETPEQVAAVIAEAAKYVANEKIIAGTNCGMAPMRSDIALAKLAALGRGAELARKTLG